jgi:YXWGXW repeat-containing protein
MSTRQLGFASIAVLAASFWLVSQSHVRGEDAPEGQEVLTHGPVHEAFAEPASANPTATIVVPKQPPAAIEEMPPDVKPDGANVVWVAGYWAWDDTRNDYIWVSGIWRDTPPGHVWVAGYWNQVADGFQWTPGFWSPAQQEQVNYLPEPPATQEAGPNIPQPSADDFWVPGYYQYVDARYVWRPGYWTVGRPDWIWTPAHYVWTPSGYIFIAGHWDYALARRGVLFAPVYFTTPIYVRPRYVFAPAVVIEPSLLTVNFFVRPSYCHYYFGDYYGANYVALGFNPWFSVGVRVGYDPLFTYYRWDHRGDRGWEAGVRDHYAYMDRHPDARPPRTFVQQTTIINNNITINKNSNNKNIAIGAPLNQYVKNVNVNGGTKFVNVSNQQRQVIAQESLKSQDIARDRAKFEGTPGAGRNGSIAAGAGAGKSLNLRALAQTSGGQLPGANGAAAAAGNRATNGVGSTFPGGSGISGRGTTGISGTAGSGTVGAGGRTTTNGSDPFRLKSGDQLKSGSTAPGNGAKQADIFKGANPSFTPSGGKGQGGQPSGRGSGDPRGNGKNDKNNQSDSRGGRTVYKPLDGSGQDQGPQTDDQPNPRGKDPVGPLKISPSQGSNVRGNSNGPSGGRDRLDSNQPPARLKDPVGPLNVTPQTPPPSRKSDNSNNGPPPRGNDANTKDPVGPLRIAPQNR